LGKELNEDLLKELLPKIANQIVALRIEKLKEDIEKQLVLKTERQEEIKELIGDEEEEEEKGKEDENGTITEEKEESSFDESRGPNLAIDESKKKDLRINKLYGKEGKQKETLDINKHFEKKPKIKKKVNERRSQQDESHDSEEESESDTSNESNESNEEATNQLPQEEEDEEVQKIKGRIAAIDKLIEEERKQITELEKKTPQNNIEEFYKFLGFDKEYSVCFIPIIL
jgi:hypothetical protein